MDGTTKDQIEAVGIIATALAVLKWIVGRSRVASTDDKYEKRFQEFERKMELALSDHKRTVRQEIDDFMENQDHKDQRAKEFQNRVLSTVDDLAANLQSLRRAFVTPQGTETPSRLR
jgi:predicted  nucleic acid-binding Zn-ribbon protein